MKNLIQCHHCKGEGNISVTPTIISCNGCKKGQTVVIDCIYCNGSGLVPPELKEQEEKERDLWCSCDRPSDYDEYYADGVHPELHKHHWRCVDCGGIVQIG